MKILHYSLGVPGFRSGGLTKYSIDLMTEQVRVGNEVSLLYPGSFKKNRGMYIRKDNYYEGISVFELINPLPVPLVNGVKNPSYYYIKHEYTKDYFEKWIVENNFDVLHIHTLMGLPIELIEVVKKIGIKIIYTTHDYYGICPKVNLVRENGAICNNNTEYAECYNCCKNGLSYNKIKIMQSKTYRYIKVNRYGKKIIGRIKKILTHKKGKAKQKCDYVINNSFIEREYETLREYYYDIFRYIDYYHFNSNITKNIFEKHLKRIKGEVISITHSDISDNRTIKSFDNKRLRIVFLGNDSIHKGLNNLIKALEKINIEFKDLWKLEIWGVDGENSSSNIIYRGKYDYSKLGNIFSESDLLVVPSIWYETFGFIGLEAFSYGVPILTTELVGFNDLIDDGITGFIVGSDIDSLYLKILSFIQDREQLSIVNRNIYSKDIDFKMKHHVLKIIDMYERM